MYSIHYHWEIFAKPISVVCIPRERSAAECTLDPITILSYSQRVGAKLQYSNYSSIYRNNNGGTNPVLGY